MAANILPQAIKEFRAQRPQLRVQLFDASPTTLMQRVRAGTLDMGLGFFKSAPGVKRVPFFRFSLMVVRPETESAPHRATTTWSALRSERLILQAPPAPVRELIDRHLTQADIDPRTATSLNRLDTVIAMVEAGEGVGIVPSFALPVCRRRNVIVSRLINPIVPVDFFQIRNRGRKLLSQPAKSLRRSSRATSRDGPGAPESLEHQRRGRTPVENIWSQRPDSRRSRFVRRSVRSSSPQWPPGRRLVVALVGIPLILLAAVAA